MLYYNVWSRELETEHQVFDELLLSCEHIVMNIEEQTEAVFSLVDISNRNPGATGQKWFPWTLEWGQCQKPWARNFLNHSYLLTSQSWHSETLEMISVHCICSHGMENCPVEGQGFSISNSKILVKPFLSHRHQVQVVRSNYDFMRPHSQRVDMWNSSGDFFHFFETAGWPQISDLWRIIWSR